MKPYYRKERNHSKLFDGIVAAGRKVTLALKNLICGNLRLARAQFARRECIPRAWFFSSRAKKRKERKNGGEKGEKRRVKRIDRKYSGRIKINSVPGECLWTVICI